MAYKIPPAAAGSGLERIEITLTSPQVKALNGTPIQAIAAPGVGNVLMIVQMVAKFTYGGTNAFVAAAGQQIQAYYGTSQIATQTQIMGSGQLNGTTASTYGAGPTGVTGGVPIASLENVAINLWNPVATEISGNAANNNTVSVSILYYTVSI